MSESQSGDDVSLEPTREERLKSLAQRESVSDETQRAARRVLRFYQEGSS